jgi:hypothetical protein
LRVLGIAGIVLFSAVTSSAGEPGRASAGIPPTAAKSQADVQKRVRELIYILRYHRLDARVDEWAGAIRELVQIGKPAAPEIVAELDRTDRSVTIRGLAFTLRAIGDPRAIPELIRALKKRDLEAGSDYAMAVSDPALMAFMQKNQDLSSGINGTFSYGRPINEIATALVKITKHPDAGVLRGLARQRYWQDWWDAHSNEFPAEKELQPAPGDRDLIEEAGIARFGPLFPTGKDIELGPVHEVELQFDGYVNARSYIDFDAGRLYQFEEGISADEAKSTDSGGAMLRWFRRSGVDARCNGNIIGIDLPLWLIDNRRWDTLPDEVRSRHLLNIGREATNSLVPFGRHDTDYHENQVGTFLFITREGGRGVIQTLPREDDETYSHKIRYRLWGEKSGHPPPTQVRKTRRNESEWGPERVGILRAPGRGQAFLMSLETGERLTPPDTLVPANTEFFSFADEKELATWCRANGANFGTIATRNASDSKVKPAVADSTTLTLVGLDLQALSVLPSSYNEMTLAELKDLMVRYPARPDQGWMPYTTEPRQDTYAFATKSGTMGVLQIKAFREEGGGIAFRYRLAKHASHKN